MNKAVPYIFFMAFVICGCSVETAFDNHQSAIITVISLLVIIACAMAMNNK